MKRLLAAAALAALILPAPAGAQEYNWSGLYVGAHAGHGWADWDADVNEGFAPATVLFGIDGGRLDDSGLFGGLQAGASYQLQGFVVGVLADVSWTDLDASALYGTQKFIDKSGAGGTSWREGFSLDSFGTVRGRLGVLASDKVLIYGTAGWAWGRGDAVHEVADGENAPHAVSKSSKSLSGWTAGGGVEWLIDPNWSLSAEYLYLDFGSERFAHDVGNQSGAADVTSASIDLHTVRIGVNYKFGP